MGGYMGNGFLEALKRAVNRREARSGGGIGIERDFEQETLSPQTLTAPVELPPPTPNRIPVQPQRLEQAAPAGQSLTDWLDNDAPNVPYTEPRDISRMTGASQGDEIMKRSLGMAPSRQVNRLPETNDLIGLNPNDPTTQAPPLAINQQGQTGVNAQSPIYDPVPPKPDARSGFVGRLRAGLEYAGMLARQDPQNFNLGTALGGFAGGAINPKSTNTQIYERETLPRYDQEQGRKYGQARNEQDLRVREAQVTGYYQGDPTLGRAKVENQYDLGLGRIGATLSGQANQREIAGERSETSRRGQDIGAQNNDKRIASNQSIKGREIELKERQFKEKMAQAERFHKDRMADLKIRHDLTRQRIAKMGQGGAGSSDKTTKAAARYAGQLITENEQLANLAGQLETTKVQLEAARNQSFPDATTIGRLEAKAGQLQAAMSASESRIRQVHKISEVETGGRLKIQKRPDGTYDFDITSGAPTAAPAPEQKTPARVATPSTGKKMTYAP